MIPLLGPLLAKPAIAGVIGFLRSVPREVWYALILAVVAWWAYAWIYDRGAASRNVEVANLQTQLVTLQEANKTNLETIAKLVAENLAWAAAARSQEQKAAEAVATVAQERDVLARELAQRRKNRGIIYHEDQDAAAWARQPLPRRISEQLRE